MKIPWIKIPLGQKTDVSNYRSLLLIISYFYYFRKKLFARFGICEFLFENHFNPE